MSSSMQELHDYYLKTRPNAQKVQRASQFLIRLCKHLRVSSPEEITQQYYANLPNMIDQYYHDEFHKAIQDKSILAEMIGRMGPESGWELALETLLIDGDSNLRQFSLQSLEYIGQKNLAVILPYIERYVNTSDKLMATVAARVLSKVYSEENESILLECAAEWQKKGQNIFLDLLKDRIENAIEHEAECTKSDAHKIYFAKLSSIINGSN